MTAEREAAIAALKELYRQAHEGDAAWPPPCVSSDCAMLATRRVFWPGTLEGEEFPTYCDACAAWMRTVTETLGCKYRDEPLPEPPGQQPIRALRVGP